MSVHEPSYRAAFLSSCRFRLLSVTDSLFPGRTLSPSLPRRSIKRRVNKTAVSLTLRCGTIVENTNIKCCPTSAVPATLCFRVKTVFVELFYYPAPWTPPPPLVSSRSGTAPASSLSSPWKREGLRRSDVLRPPTHPRRSVRPSVRLPCRAPPEVLGSFELSAAFPGTGAVKMALLSPCVWQGCSSSTEPVTSSRGR